MHEVPDRASALRPLREYVNEPERTLVVSPDNRSRTEINEVIHHAMQSVGRVADRDHHVRVLVPRQEITGADRQWAEQYDRGDIVRYTRGSEKLGIQAGEYARVERVNAKENLVTVTRHDGEQVTYDPRRLQGVTLYREMDRAFASGERIQFRAPDRVRQVANRELGTIEAIDGSGHVRVRLDSGRNVALSAGERAHLDHGYAVTSTDQGQTAGRVLLRIDTDRAGSSCQSATCPRRPVTRPARRADLYQR